MVFTVSVPPSLLSQFDEVALRQNRSRAGMIMTLMQQAVEEQEEGDSAAPRRSNPRTKAAALPVVLRRSA